MYVIGGSGTYGDFLNDVQILDLSKRIVRLDNNFLENFVWERIELKKPPKGSILLEF